MISSIELGVRVAATAQMGQIFVGEVLHHFEQPRVLTKQIFADKATTSHSIFLVLAIDNLVETLDKHSVMIAGQEWIPLRPPDHFDHVPTRPAKKGLQFLNDFAVAAHWSV